MFRAPLAVLFCCAAGVASPGAGADDKGGNKVQIVAGEFRSYKDTKLVVRVGKEEVTYKVAADFKVDSGVDGRTYQVTAEKFFEKLKEGHRLEIKAEGGKVTGVSDRQTAKK